MAVSIVMTGTGRNCTLTSGSSIINVSSSSGLVVGATIQGTGIPTGSRIRSISGTTVIMENVAGGDATASLSGTQSLIFSSVWGSVLSISMSASGDTANMDSIISAGFGVKQRGLATREVFFPGALGIEWKNIVAGAVFDFQNWTIECGSGGYWAWEQSSILGELRGGYLVNGAQFLKSSGPTFISNNFKNSQAGGANMFTGTATGAVTGTFRMNNLRVIYQVGSNTAPYFACGRMNCLVDNMILDYQGGGGPNAGMSAAFGFVNNTTIVKANSGLGNPNGGQYATVNGLTYSGIFTDTPNHKFAIPNNYVLEGYAPQVLSTQTLGAFQGGTTETYANIDLSTAGWGLDDLKAKYFRYGGPNTINFPRRVTFEFNDSTAVNLTGVTLYIKSGSTSVINAVQAGDYDANTQALVLTWTTTTNAYRIRDSFIDTIAQVAQVRKYGYVEQSTSYSLNIAKYSQPFFMLADASLGGISESAAAAITTAGIDWTTKTITPVADLSYDQINARIAYELAQTANSAQVDPRTIVGDKMTLSVGWSLIVNTGRTINAGTNITYLYAPVVTLNGTAKITAIYATPAGTSTIWQFEGLTLGTHSACAVWDAAGNTLLYERNPDVPIKRLYLPPGSDLGELTYGISQYGKKFETGTFPADAGGLIFYRPAYGDDVGIVEQDLAVVEAYAKADTLTEVYDAAAAFKLTEQGIKLGDIAIRSGTAIEVGSYSVKVKQNATSVFGVAGNLITIKSTLLAGDSKYSTIIAAAPATVTADTNEVITANIEDANGNSSLEIQGGSGNFTLWKIPNATAEDDYATGVNLGTVGNVRFRFVAAPGYKIIVRDNTTGFRQLSPMDKGVYTAGLFFGGQVQLVQAPQVVENGVKLSVLQVAVDALIASLEEVKGDGFVSSDSLHLIKSVIDALPILSEIESSTVLAKETSVASVGSLVADLPLLSEIEASTVLAKESSITALGSPLQADDYVAPDNSKIATIDTNVASIGTLVADLPLLADIEASTVLAKESSITALGSPLQADDYVVPDNATIAEIQTKVDTLQNVDLSNVPADVWAYAVRTLTTAAGLTEEQVALLEGIKTQTDLLPAQPAGVGDAMTLTTAYDASKTAASQSSVTALGSPLQAGDYEAPDNAGIAVLVTDVGNVPLAVRQELATELARIDVEVSSRSDLTVEDIPEGLTVAEIEASTVLAKEKSVQNTMAIAASRIAF